MTEEIRNNARKFLTDELGIIKSEDVVDLERGIYNWCISFCEESNSIVQRNSLEDFQRVYNDKFKSIMINIRGKHNIIEKLNNKEIQGRELANYRPHDWNPDSWKETISEKLKRSTASGAVQQNTTDLFRCGKCKQRHTSYYELQIRSADEPATIFITCLNPKCKNQWRIG